jgi:cellulose synthase/poly-beta-1,6-N-acetylglucosamine synthase-like glycosyltransferase
MISILLVAYKEPKTIGRSIQAFLNQDLPKDWEMLLAAPDKETLDVMRHYESKNVKVYVDPRKGKPAALNMLLPKAKGDILILSDGDVFIGKYSIRNLLSHFKDEKVGAVTSRPISLNSRDNKLGYWSHLLTDVGAHKTRLRRKGKFIICSGYLFAMRKLFDRIPEDALSDDAIMSHIIWKKGFKINYEPKSKVFVKYPRSFSDWILQKRRSAGGYTQIPKYFKNPPRMRSFTSEAFWGALTVWSYPKSFREMFWTFQLFFARLYLWYRIKSDLKEKDLLSIWKPIKSTK